MLLLQEEDFPFCRNSAPLNGTYLAERNRLVYTEHGIPPALLVSHIVLQGPQFYYFKQALSSYACERSFNT